MDEKWQFDDTLYLEKSFREQFLFSSGLHFIGTYVTRSKAKVILYWTLTLNFSSQCNVLPEEGGDRLGRGWLDDSSFHVSVEHHLFILP